MRISSSSWRNCSVSVILRFICCATRGPSQGGPARRPGQAATTTPATWARGSTDLDLGATARRAVALDLRVLDLARQRRLALLELAGLPVRVGPVQA